jgi:DNA-nicking Smr family endonuclease
MSDDVTLESLLLTDDGLSYRRPGIAPDVVSRLRKGQWALQGEIDLHGLNREEARDALANFVREAHGRGMRCVRVVHGKGHGSPGRQSVLKEKVHRWLAQRVEVIAFAQATGPQGGAGALVVLLDRLGR